VVGELFGWFGASGEKQGGFSFFSGCFFTLPLREIKLVLAAFSRTSRLGFSPGLLPLLRGPAISVTGVFWFAESEPGPPVR